MSIRIRCYSLPSEKSDRYVKRVTGSFPLNSGIVGAAVFLIADILYRALIGAGLVLGRFTSGPSPHDSVLVSHLVLIVLLGLLSKNMIKGFLITWGVVGFYELYLTIYWDLTRYWVNVGIEQILIYSSYIIVIYLTIRWWPEARLAFLGLFLFMGVIESGFESWLFNLDYHSTLAPSTSPTTSPYFLNLIDNEVEILNVVLACILFFILYFLAWNRLRKYDLA